MVKCAVLSCKSSSKTVGRENGDISFHGFPTNPKIKEKWIDATGNVNWFPNKHSKICSIHFDPNCFTETDKFRRLIKTAYPTIRVLKLIEDEPTTEKNNTNNSPIKIKIEQDTDQPSTSEENLKDTRKKKSILTKLNQARQTIKEKDKHIKRLREQNRRKQKKIRSLVELLVQLKKKTLMNKRDH